MAEQFESRDLEEATRDAVLTRGLGRSYGDASLPPPGRGPVASSLLADRVLAFDESSGQLRAEAGLHLGRLLEMLLPRGFYVPVTPGTRDVTLGGMVAADVHGKNHHVAGTIGAHVDAMRMRMADGGVVYAREKTHPELFRATLGGMGLTGHILDVTMTLVRVPSGSIVERTTAFPDLESLVDGLERASAEWPFTVAWADFLAAGAARGRGVLSCGRWAAPAEAARAAGGFAPRLAVPFAMPDRLLGDRGIGAFNSLRFAMAASARGGREAVRDASSFFHPLDAIGSWNLLYGSRGFTQYQCVLPRDATMRSFRRLVDVACSGGPGPFLVVLKDCGAEGKGLLSFPRPGVSFAMDFPVHEGTADLVARLNEVAIDAGGRVYLAKDAFTTAEHFAAMEPRLPAFLDVRRRLDPERRLDSALARRLMPD